jgi:hypothetical protein
MKFKHQKWNPKIQCNTFWKVFKTWRFSCVTPSTNLLQIQTTNSLIHLGNFYHHFKLLHHLFPIVFSHSWFMFCNNLTSQILWQALLLLWTLLKTLLHILLSPSQVQLVMLIHTLPLSIIYSNFVIISSFCYKKLLHTLLLHFHVSLFVKFMRKT